MPLTVVAGGQFGSEGKGKIACHLAERQKASFAIRCGAPNSGHTVVDKRGNLLVFRHLPTAAILPNVRLAIGAGSYLDVSVLLKEMASLKLKPERLCIDPMACIITREMKRKEFASGLVGRIGSTGSGAGEAVIARAARKPETLFAKDIPALIPYIGDVSSTLRTHLSLGERIILEGTQGFGLSPLHSGYYPEATSRDTTAASFVSEAGLSPLDVDEIALVIRTFPIRVGGNSGFLPDEIDWDIITREGSHKRPVMEYTTVTHKVRRVGRFNPEIVKRAIAINRPTHIYLNHVDYVKCGIAKNEARIYAEEIGELIGHKISGFGLSPSNITY